MIHRVLFTLIENSSFLCFSAFTDGKIRTGEGILLVYSMSLRHTFEQIRPSFEQILRVKGEGSFPVVIVANKCDLEYERQVSIEGESSAPNDDPDF